MECPKCKGKEYETDAMMLVMGQEGEDEKMLVVHTCKAEGCGEKWRGKAY
ncbi:MAG: hypothetical protein VW270_02630 [Candidatus Poseidoniales archaeon]